ncbi:SAM-dependent methyltransferase [Shewanella phaeophyticola]|uniref:SAM-dependent methyltransferase n=1 Tax=Shewanella phaeophyticola TaxID=2978345 RepID=A0ABT2P3K6_9GAMM|nr:SAM-dependent methyltransferase [Shewanella sp. KJ10-1]MCT8987067.1 SAM-dependent methyltransferase [Shewanella sp. KJ10-1]
MSAIDYQHTFKSLDSLLEALKPLWQLVAFECDHLPWQQAFPCLAQTVWQLNDAELDNIDADQDKLVQTLLPSLISDIKQSEKLNADELIEQLNLLVITLPTSLSTADPTGQEQADLTHFSAHIKGRKWQQISAFAEHINPQQQAHLTPLPVLEWCAGKGHLGRLVAKQQQVQVTSLEWQASLCEQGQAFATQWQLPQRFICADAFASFNSNETIFYPQQHAIALHACGDLHVRLIKLATNADTQAISISPCCYHLIQGSHYQPLSTQAKASNLKLAKHDLQLPLQQSVIASPKQQARRLQEVAWRLGFDSLQRDIRDINAYLPVPTIKQSQLSSSFVDFCVWAAAQKGLTLTNDIDFDVFLQRGIARQRLTKRIDLVAHLFRRALECWLLLDRVCFLQQQGYRVLLSEFCPNSVTPRNAFIQAIKTAT